MKKLLLSFVAIISFATYISAAQYLISPAATITGSKISHKGIDFVVGTTAFSDFSTLATANLEENSTVYVAP